MTGHSQGKEATHVCSKHFYDVVELSAIKDIYVVACVAIEEDAAAISLSLSLLAWHKLTVNTAANGK